MANEFINSVKDVAQKITEYVKNASELTVETRYVVLGEKELNFDTASVAAKTVIRMDGDSYAVMPMRKGDNGQLEVDSALFGLHQQNVTTAIDYRASILDSLLQILKQQ